MIGSKVNGKLVPIDYVIQNGDRIEVLTSQNSKGPSRDWLNIVKSTQAKNKINQWFKNELKDDNIQKGKDLISQYCKAKSINMTEVMKTVYMTAVMRKYGFKDWDSVLAAVGHGGFKEGQVVNKLQELYDKEHKHKITDKDVMDNLPDGKERPVQHKTKSGIVVKGIHDVAVRFSKCCGPVPGDEIVGFVTRGRGVSIHRTDCINILSLSDIDRERLIDAEWQHTENIPKDEMYVAEVNIYGINRTGLLVDISKVLTEKQIDVTSMNVRTSKQGTATINVSFHVRSRDELIQVSDRLRQVEGILDIERTTG